MHYTDCIWVAGPARLWSRLTAHPVRASLLLLCILIASGSKAASQTILGVLPSYIDGDPVMSVMLTEWARSLDGGQFRRLGVDIAKARAVDGRAAVRRVQSREADFTLVSTSDLDAFSGQRTRVFDFPYLFPNIPSVLRFQRGPAGQAILASLEEHGLVGLAFWNRGLTKLVSRSPIHDFSDLRGMKFYGRVPVDTEQVIKGLGANPVQTQMSDAPTALRSARADVAEVAPFEDNETYKTFSFYVAGSNFRPLVSVLIFNAQAWTALTYRQQAAISGSARSVAARQKLDTLPGVMDPKKPTDPKVQVQSSDLLQLGTLVELSPQGAAGLRGAAISQIVNRSAPVNELYSIISDAAKIDASGGPTEVARAPSQPSAPLLATRAVLYVTDRYLEDRGGYPGSRFGGVRGKEMSVGVVTVSADHLRRVADSVSGTTIRTLTTEPFSAFGSTVRDALNRSRTKEILIFVHGFNTTFADAAVRAAMMAQDLNFSGVVIAYSWPSDGSAVRYISDSQEVEWTEPHFRELMNELDKLGEVKVSVVAHSMGSKIVMRWAETMKLPALKHIVIAAPDVDSDIFRRQASAVRQGSASLTLYASDNDWALEISKHLNKYSRAGQAGKELVVAPGLDTIDASSADTSMWGHNYFASSRTILTDVHLLVMHDVPPERRIGLEPRRHHEMTYWFMRP